MSPHFQHFLFFPKGPFWARDTLFVPLYSPLHEISAKNGVVEFLPPALFFRPFAQFLCQPAVVGFLAVAQGQARFSAPSANGLLPGRCSPSSAKLFRIQPFFRRFRMKGTPPLNCDFQISLSFSPGNK
jgi:hypothetical protein